MQETLELVNIELIIANPFQPRKAFEELELAELASSIKMHGLLQPPIVRKHENRFELIAGERRVRAAKLAGLTTIPVIIKDSSASACAEAALIENIQRVDLNPIETATAIQRLMAQFHLTQEEVAIRVGKKRSTIANFLRLLSLPETIRQGLSQDLISMGHAKVILSLQSHYEQLRLFDAIVREGLSVQASAKKASETGKVKEKLKKRSEVKDLHIDEIVDLLQHRLGTKVQVSPAGKKGGGQLQITYYDTDDLNRLLDIFQISLED